MSCNCRRFISSILELLGFYKYVLATKVYFEGHAKLKNIHAEIYRRLSKKVNIIEQSEEDCDVSLMICPIASRAGTNIEAALCRTRADKPTLLFILHHTYNKEYTAAAGSSKYEANNLKLVELLFHEDQGLLDCSRNKDAFTKAENFLEQNAKRQRKVNFRRVLIVSMIGICILYKTWDSLPSLPSLNQLNRLNQ